MIEPRPRVRFSVLDLCHITQGGSAAETFRHAQDLARRAEGLGYHRYWLAEHHNIPGIASAATAVVIGHVAAATSTIRVGSGGIMLPNHAPLTIAEQFGTLETLYPGRIDLGLGRAPGGDHATARALRRYANSADAFPQDVRELLGYFSEPLPGQAVRAVPGAGLRVPLSILGSSTFGARLAAELGLPFAFASHFAPDYLEEALEIYRSRFEPSESLASPHAMVAVNVVASDTDAEARRLFTTLQQMFLNLVRGTPSRMPPPVDALGWFPAEEAHVRRMLRCSAVGGADRVAGELRALLDATRADEIICTFPIYDPAARVRSLEIAADVFRRLDSFPLPEIQTHQLTS